MVTGAGGLKVVDLGLATVGSLVVASSAEEGEAGGTNSADVAARLGGCTCLYASPEVKAHQQLPEADKQRTTIRGRDHDQFACMLVVLEMILGRKPNMIGNRLVKQVGRLPIEVVRSWSAADVKAWASDNKLTKLAAPFEERGVDGAALMRLDKETLVRDFGVKLATVQSFFNKLSVWPLPLPELLIALLRAGVDPDPARRPRLMGVVVRSLEPMLEGAGGAMPAEALAEEGSAALLGDDETAEFHNDVGQALMFQLRHCENCTK